MIQATLLIAGRVQGVGFRFTTNEVAKSHAIVGTVENLEDGRVKIVVEGEPDVIEQFVLHVQSRMSGKIKSINRFDCEASLIFSDFQILR